MLTHPDAVADAIERLAGAVDAGGPTTENSAVP